MANTAAGPIEYAETGAGVPLLSIHGAGRGSDQGLANVADLVGEGFRVIAPSRFGYLGTPMPPDTSSASQADAHAALLNELKVDKAIVVGISAGARSAAELAIRHPERVTALILIVPGTYAPTSPVALEGSRTSALVLWLVNTGADFAWWAAEKVAPSILIRFIGVPPQLFSSSREAEQNRVVRIVRDIKPLSWRFSGINIDSNPARSVRPFSSAAVLSALGLEPLAPFPLPSPARFSRSVPEPDRASCCLHAGCRSGSIRTSPELIPEEGSPPVLASPNLLSTLQKQLD